MYFYREPNLMHLLHVSFFFTKLFSKILLLILWATGTVATANTDANTDGVLGRVADTDVLQIRGCCWRLEWSGHKWTTISASVNTLWIEVSPHVLLEWLFGIRSHFFALITSAHLHSQFTKMQNSSDNAFTKISAYFLTSTVGSL